MTEFLSAEFFVFIGSAVAIVSIAYWFGKKSGIESGYRHGLIDGIREGRK